MIRRILIAITLALPLSLGLAESSAPDAADITAAVQRFHEALAKGDQAGVMDLLAPDAVILESGAKQSRQEYAREHLSEDIAFAKATQTTTSDSVVRQEGDVAWATTTSHTSGLFSGRPIKAVGVELTVLSKTEAGWRIHAISWSSHSLGGKP